MTIAAQDRVQVCRVPSPSPVQTVRDLTCLELFAGPGGLALGAHAANFKHVGLVEFERYAAQTLRENSGLLGIDPCVVIQKDAREVDYTPYTDNVDLLTAGPPCQPFSGGGSGIGPNDERNMFPELLRAVADILPAAVLIENVIGITRTKFKEYLAYIELRLTYPLLREHPREDWHAHYERLKHLTQTSFAENSRYVVGHQVVNAANFGVPQQRQRVFILAFRRDLGIEIFRQPETHSKNALLWEQWQSKVYWSRHGIDPLPCWEVLGKQDDYCADKACQRQLPSDAPWQTVRDAIADLAPPVTRGEKPQIANHVQHPGARAYTGHAGSVYDLPAKALKAGAHGTPGGENMVRASGTDEVRYFTTREAARLQTFPDEWTFSGTWGGCIRQLGNAVPMKLAQVFTTQIHNRLAAALGLVVPGLQPIPVHHDQPFSISARQHALDS